MFPAGVRGECDCVEVEWRPVDGGTKRFKDCFIDEQIPTVEGEDKWEQSAVR